MPWLNVYQGFHNEEGHYWCVISVEHGVEEDG